MPSLGTEEYMRHGRSVLNIRHGYRFGPTHPCLTTTGRESQAPCDGAKLMAPEPITVADVENDPGHAAYIPSVPKRGQRRARFIPMVSGGRLLGQIHGLL